MKRLITILCILLIAFNIHANSMNSSESIKGRQFQLRFTDGLSFKIRAIDADSKIVEIDDIMVEVGGVEYGLLPVFKFPFNGLFDTFGNSSEFICSRASYSKSIQAITNKEWTNRFIQKNWLGSVVEFRHAMFDDSGYIGSIGTSGKTVMSQATVLKKVLCRK